MNIGLAYKLPQTSNFFLVEIVTWNYKVFIHLPQYYNCLVDLMTPLYPLDIFLFYIST
jgi:hypothetical protein